MNKKTIVVGGIGFSLGCFSAIIIGSLLFIISAILFFQWINRTPQHIQADWSVPLSVEKRDEFIIELNITNTGEEDQKLIGIDLEQSYLDGFKVLRVDPPYASTYEYDSFGSYQGFDFFLDLPAHETVKLEFYVSAIKEGDFSGNLDICVQHVASCLESSTRTVVEKQVY